MRVFICDPLFCRICLLLFANNGRQIIQGARLEVFEMLRLYLTKAKGADIRSKALQVIRYQFCRFLYRCCCGFLLRQG